MGRAVSTEEFARICLCLQESKAENINIVTGSHAVPALVTGINAAKALGLHIPVLWNSSAYEKTTTLEMLTGVVDGYMPDLKTLDPDIADRFFAAQHYPEIAIRALKFMMDYSDKVIIRHLVLPGLLDSTYTVLRWFADHAYGRAQLSVMMQYTPVQTGQGPDRYVNEEEYKTILRWIDELGIEDGFYQELLPDSSWLPDFSRYNPFSSELSTPIWHWRQSME
jgi:putative pyruvate formate lyase activating enzyme